MKTLPLPILLTAILLAGCNTSARPLPEPRTTPVRVAEVRQEMRGEPIRTSGRLAPKRQAHLSFKTGGLVADLLADEGDRVKAGQVLARLDLSEIDARVRAARSALAKAERDVARLEALFRDSVATLEQVQDARTARDVARAEWDVAAFNRRHSEIVAPAAGRILERRAEVGELVTPGQAIFVFGAEHGWVVRAGIADRDVVRLRPGDRAEVHFDAFPGRIFEGRLTEIGDAADPRTGTFEIEVTVDDPGHRLKAGFVAGLALYPAATAPVTLVPVAALVEAEGETGVVYTLDATGRRVAHRTVRIAALLGDSLSIHAGLEAGERVVTDGAAYLHDGDPVRVVPSATVSPVDR